MSTASGRASPTRTWHGCCTRAATCRSVTHDAGVRLPPVKQFLKVVDASGREVTVDSLVGGGGGALVSGAAPAVLEGFAWVAAEPGVDVLEPGERCVFATERDGLFPSGKGFVRGELLDLASVDGFLAKRKRILSSTQEEMEERGEEDADVGRAAGLRRRLREGAGGGAAEAEETTESGGDLRTLAID